MLRAILPCAKFARRSTLTVAQLHSTQATKNQLHVEDLVDRFNNECRLRHDIEEDLRKCLDKAGGIAYGVAIAACRVSDAEVSHALRDLERAVGTLEKTPMLNAYKIKKLLERLNELD